MKIHIGIKETDRAEIIEGLSHLLADTSVLYQKTHGFHWNVTGPMFQTLHLMFEGQYTELWNAVDLIAERIRALGAVAPGSYGQLLHLAKVEEADGVPAATEMIRQLVVGHEVVIHTARSLVEAAGKANDQGTLDLLTQRLIIHEKTAWMLRSLLE